MKKINAKSFALDALALIIGSLLVAISVSMFTAPNNIAPGGVSGLATALAYITPLSIARWNIILNLPLFIIAWKKLGLRSMLLTVISAVLTSVFIELIELYLPSYTNNTLLAAVFGGAVCGAGIGFLFIRALSSGGTDLLALVLKKVFPHIPSGTILLIIDGIVVLIAVIIFHNIEVALYSVIAIYVSSKVIDAMTQGVDYAKVAYTITENADEICKALTTELDLGATIIPGFGGYTGNEKKVVMVVTRRRKVPQIVKLIKEIDPKSFTFVIDSTEVHGEGFKLN